MKKSFTATSLTVMKITMAQLLIAFLIIGFSYARDGQAQLLDRKISLRLNNEKLITVLGQIEQKAKVRFAYSADQLDLDELIAVDAHQQRLMDILDYVLTSRGISFRVHEKDNVITLKKSSSKAVPATGKVVTAPTVMTVRGKVVDGANQQPMPGVNVLVKGTARGTNTDAQGLYSLEVEDNSVLIFSFIGYGTVEETVGDRTTIDIVLREDIETLKEVEVNAGYWTVTERNKTGNISRVTAEDIQRQPITNPLGALVGAMPGVFVQQTNGVPGGAYRVQIRGRNSIGAGNQPLYIVDGVPFTSSTLTSDGLSYEIVSEASPLNSLDPGSIESIEVLKDADATAIYGSRGANGVVLITTKKGVAGSTRVDLNTSTGWNWVNRKMDILNTEQYVAMRREAFQNDEVTPTPINADDLLVWDTTRYTDYQEALVGETAQVYNASLNVSGGSANTQFMMNTGYHRETTVFPGDFSYQRLSTLFSLSHTTQNSKFNVTFSVNYSADFNRLPAVDPSSNALLTPPNAPDFYDEDGNLLFPANLTNPYQYLRRQYDADSDNLIINSTLSYRITKGITARVSTGYTIMHRDETQTIPGSSINPDFGIQPSSQFADNNIKTWIVEPQVSWDTKIGYNKVSVLLGTTFQENIREGETLHASGFTSDALLNDPGAASSVYITSSQYAQYRYNAVFGRFNYTLRDKFIINVTGRHDGSTRFGEDKRFATFGAAGVAYIFSEENFVRTHLPFLTFGKLRTSYGITGNDQIGDYQYMELWGSTSYPYRGNAGLYPTRIANQDYAWETNQKWEGELELGFLQDRLRTTASYYQNRSSNQLVGNSLAPSTGFTYFQNNLDALVENSGVELELRITSVRTNDLDILTYIHFTAPRNKLIRFPGIEGTGYDYELEVGEPLSIVKAYHVLGVDEATGVYQFEDIGEPGLSLEDRISIRERTQQYYGGLQNTMRFRNWTFDFSFQFVKQTGNNYLVDFPSPGMRFNQPDFVLKRWQQEGDQSDVQKFTQQIGSAAWFAHYNVRFNGDTRISDASFVRLKNVSLSYSLPASWMNKVQLREAKFYVQGQNLFTLTGYEGWDPENQSTRQLPPLATVLVGVQLIF